MHEILWIKVSLSGAEVTKKKKEKNVLGAHFMLKSEFVYQFD